MIVQPDPAGFERLIVAAPEFGAAFEVSGVCPVQAWGEVRGRDLYFRARYDGWGFDIADDRGVLPSDGGGIDSGGFRREGNYPLASWMPHTEAVAVIERCLKEYAAQVGPPPSS